MRTSIVKNFLITGVVAMGVASIIRANEKREFVSSALSLSSNDMTLINQLAQANISEIANAKVAIEKSKNDHIVKFAQSMIADHSKALEQLSTLAKTKNLNLTKIADTNQQAAMDALKMLDEDQFDRKYVLQVGINDHQKALALIDEVKETANDEELKSLAKKLRLTISHHLKMAESMKGLVSH